MMLRDVMTPLPMRAGWGQDMAWPYPGIPKTVIADLAGYEVAGLPFFPIETVTTDHGSVYKNHHLVEVQRVIGANIRPGVMINGGGCQGKTETICEVIASFEDEWLALYDQNPDALPGTLDQHAPVAYVRTPVKATPISTCQRILDFYGEDYKGMRQEDLIRTVKNAIYDHGTKALVLDDITRLKLHREADQDVLDLIRELMSLPVTLILAGVGIPRSGLLRDGRKDPRTGQWLFPPVKDRGKSRNDDAPGQTDLRFDLLDPASQPSHATPSSTTAAAPSPRARVERPCPLSRHSAGACSRFPMNPCPGSFCGSPAGSDYPRPASPRGPAWCQPDTAAPAFRRAC
jgi:hypothetical protein